MTSCSLVFDLFWLKKYYTNGECLYEKRKGDNETYQWLFKEKSKLLRNIKCIKVCLQSFSAVSLHTLCLVRYCSSLALRGESPYAPDTQISTFILPLSLLLLPLSHPFFAHSQQQRANQISCTVKFTEQSWNPLLFTVCNIEDIFLFLAVDERYWKQ